MMCDQEEIFIEEAGDTPRASTSTSSTSPSSTSTSRRDRLGPILAIVVVISLFGNAVLVTVVLINWGKRDPTPEPKPPRGQLGQMDRVCFTCGEYGPMIESRDTIYDVLRPAPGETLCCLRENMVAKGLIQNIILDKFSHIDKNGRKTRPISSEHQYLQRRTGAIGAHLYLQLEGNRPHWHQSDPYDIAYCSGVTCYDGNITINDAGKYLVYAQIIIKPAVTNGNRVLCIKRNNSKYASMGTHDLLVSKTSPSVKTETSYLSAIVKLRKGDNLSVTITEEYHRFLADGLSNFFGVMKMGGH